LKVYFNIISAIVSSFFPFFDDNSLLFSWY
jgi:hypothetical protein